MDLSFRKIFNFFTIPAALLGFIYSIFNLGAEGGLQSILGMLSGLILFGGLFGFKVLGGGDVKLLMVFGAWGGYRYVLDVALLSILLGGFISILTLIFNRKFLNFSKKMLSFLISILIKELLVQWPKIDSSQTIPFGLPMAVAAIWVMLKNPFHGMGFGSLF